MPTQVRHHHGYMWLGSGTELLKDGPRRPAHPEFRAAKVVPLELAHWLLKPTSFVQGTWHKPQEAADWFGQQARYHASCFTSARDRSEEVLSNQITNVSKAVAGGQDVAGGWYLTGQRFLSVCLIACSPHRFRPEYACPQR
jgi:hypothetical protein